MHKRLTVYLPPPQQRKKRHTNTVLILILCKFVREECNILVVWKVIYNSVPKGP